MNLVYRWDISLEEEDEVYFMELFIIGQRKGIYKACRIEEVTDKDVESIVKYVGKSWEKLKSIWTPLNK